MMPNMDSPRVGMAFGKWIDYAIGIMSSLLRAKGNTDPTQTDMHCLSQRTHVVVINIDIS